MEMAFTSIMLCQVCLALSHHTQIIKLLSSPFGALIFCIQPILGFPGGSMIKNPPASAGDTGSIPGLGRSPGEGNATRSRILGISLVAQMVKRLPTMWEMWVQSLGWEDPLEEGMATHSSILSWRIPVDRRATVHGVTKSQT